MEGPGSLEEWVRLFKEYPEGIEDQYGMHVTPTEMMTKITERSWGCDSRQIPRGYSSWEDFYRANSAEEGPQGLLRHRIDGKHCVGHGSGTWDLIAGEFS